MELFFQQVVNGIQSGVIYASLALAIVLIFRSTSLLNFAQGELAMFSTFAAWQLEDAGLPIVLAILGAMALSMVGGAVIERVIIRPVGKDNVLAIVIVTIGLFIAVNALAGWIYGTDGRTFPRIFENTPLVEFGDVTITRETIGTAGILLIVVGLLFLLFQKTKVGLAMRAVASNDESARLVGIRVGRMLMFGWGLAAALGALAGAFAAPQLSLSQNLMLSVLVYSFAAATLGGFDSPLGAVVGGMIVGITQNLAGQYIDFFDGFELASAFLLILVVLLVRPQGLFGKKVVTRV
ncbi:MAG TPA: branched-chain amino acid ABC transporter permease [Acidimicrobiia bacterium]|nr:branched-chain amino acid ABC transporter permease [Acidimicrobiia bacterium]